MLRTLFTKTSAASLVRPSISARAYAAAASADAPAMLCYQCQQTDLSNPELPGCTVIGNCGKTPEVAGLQDLLMHSLKGTSMYAHRARQLGASDPAIDAFTLRSMFSTLTNVNFDPDRFNNFLKEADQLKQSAKALYEKACSEKNVTPEALESNPAASWRFDANKSNEELSAEGLDHGVFSRKLELGPDLTGLHELCVYGLKGLAAYAEHAHKLGKSDDEVFAFIHRALSDLASTSVATPAGDLLTLALECGKYNLRVTQLLDEAHRDKFGIPGPVSVRRSPLKGKCVLVTGHDMKDLHDLLTQVEGTDINVYTHGEMMPAHSYPGLKKFKNLAGHYGSAWQNQKNDFARFPGPIVATSNCIIEPRKSYKHRLFTRDVTGWPGAQHLTSNDYGPVIASANAESGFAEDGDASDTITVGFGHDAILGLADTVIQMVKDGDIGHFYLIGGCDGAHGERSYFTDLAREIAKRDDGVVLSLGCGKFRVMDELPGDIKGVPKYLDVGQCNDSYGAVKIASALAEAFKTDVNGLPLSFMVSWFEQKAVAVLLTLLHLNVKGIRIGPTLPGFVTPNMLAILQKEFDLKLIGDAKEDLAMALQGK